MQPKRTLTTWTDLAQHHGASVPTPTSSDLRGMRKMIPTITSKPTPEPSVPIQLLPAGSQADPELLPPAHPVDDLGDQFQQLQYDLADRLVDTSPIASPHSFDPEEPLARLSEQSESQDSTIQSPNTQYLQAILSTTLLKENAQESLLTVGLFTQLLLPFKHKTPTLFFMLLFTSCDVEIYNLDKRSTFKIVGKPNDLFVVPLMWVFDYKFDDNGFLLRHRSRIVVRGDLQPPSNKQTYANTLAMRAWRALTALICAFDLETWHFDAVNAFLNSRLNPDEQVYCHMQPSYYYVPYMASPAPVSLMPRVRLPLGKVPYRCSGFLASSLSCLSLRYPSLFYSTCPEMSTPSWTPFCTQKPNYKHDEQFRDQQACSNCGQANPFYRAGSPNSVIIVGPSGLLNFRQLSKDLGSNLSSKNFASCATAE
ncbi:hypothetical protein Egran_03191 [Elaphomyces granulatus]|uniref:Reverse transcriptase Ty1/copia-type domain-containing protein n=1 Tax=Elaphomyces granulatus TaxID=519963 RepID=A0A232LY11_9EURO|nr:hypothetical protein Egran_03191 [Elaphomyces granulatus]